MEERNEGRKDGLTAALMVLKECDSLEEAKEIIEARLLELRGACERCGGFDFSADEGVMRCDGCGYAYFEEDWERDEEENDR